LAGSGRACDVRVGFYRRRWQVLVAKDWLLDVAAPVVCRSLFFVHAWIQWVRNLSRGQGKLAILLGFVLFFAVYGFVWLLRRNFYGTEANDHP